MRNRTLVVLLLGLVVTWLLVGCSGADATESPAPEGARPSAEPPRREVGPGDAAAPDPDASVAVTRVGPSDAAIAAQDAPISNGSTSDASEADASATHDADVDANAAPSDASGGGDAGSAPDAENSADSGSIVDAGGEPLCALAAVAESEPNDTAGAATPFTTSVCGTLAPNGDRDFVTGTPPSINFLLEMLGDIEITVTIDGQTVTVPPAVTIPYVPGKPYVIEVRAKHPELGVPTGWRIRFILT